MSKKVIEIFRNEIKSMVLEEYNFKHWKNKWWLKLLAGMALKIQIKGAAQLFFPQNNTLISKFWELSLW